MVLKDLKSGIFNLVPTLTFKQSYQRLPIALVQVKTSNISGDLVNEFGQIVSFLNQAKEIIKTVCNNIMQVLNGYCIDEFIKKVKHLTKIGFCSILPTK